MLDRLASRYVKTVKLSAAKGFILLDLPDADRSVGVVRSAPSILQSGATNLARSVTYSLASFGIQAGGASAGVNAKPDERADAVASFVQDALPLAENDGLLLDAGRGVKEDELAALRPYDPRPAWLRTEEGGISGADYLVVAGVNAAASAVGTPLEGATIAIEGLSYISLALADHVVATGGKVVAVGTAAGTALNPDGFDISAVFEAWSSGGDACVKSIGGELKPAWAIFGAECDALLLGSKVGALTHEGAAQVTATSLLPTGPVPFTTKALVVLERAGRKVVPDFLTLAGPYLAAFGDVGDGADEAAQGVSVQVAAAVRDAAGSSAGLFLGACARAEDFLATWQVSRPFGRPLA